MGWVLLSYLLDHLINFYMHTPRPVKNADSDLVGLGENLRFDIPIRLSGDLARTLGRKTLDYGSLSIVFR